MAVVFQRGGMDVKESFCVILPTKLSLKGLWPMWPSKVGRYFGAGLVLFSRSKDSEVTGRLLCRQTKSIQDKLKGGFAGSALRRIQ